MNNKTQNVIETTRPRVIVVVLRRPLNEPDEMRSDPFWEFGSFGCARCHQRNLMNPKKIHLLTGARLAFAQGGESGFKLVYLTPPVETFRHSVRGEDFAEVKWRPASMPFKYSVAPLFIDNNGNSDAPLLRESIDKTNRPTWESKFASRFRSRRKPVRAEIAQEIIEVFESKLASGDPIILASTYVEALPYRPNKPDTNRKQTYQKLLTDYEGGML